MHKQFLSLILLIIVITFSGCNKATRTIRQDLVGSYAVNSISLLGDLDSSKFYAWITDTVDTPTDSMITIVTVSDSSTTTDTAWISIWQSSEQLANEYFSGTVYYFNGCKKLKKTCDGGIQVSPSTGGSYTNTFEYQFSENGTEVALAHNNYGVITSETLTNVELEDGTLRFSGEVILNLGDTGNTEQFIVVPADYTLVLSE